ncbi:MAG: RidA family protein [Promethearchaeota archaeon]
MSPKTPKKEVVYTESAPQPVGPYSQAIRAGDLVFVAGQVPFDPVAGEFVRGTIADQARQCMENIRAIVEAAGGTLSQLVKTTIFLTNIADFTVVNEVYGNYFDLAPPARSTVQVAALPKGVAIEIEAIANVPLKS